MKAAPLHSNASCLSCRARGISLSWDKLLWRRGRNWLRTRHPCPTQDLFNYAIFQHMQNASLVQRPVLEQWESPAEVWAVGCTDLVWKQCTSCCTPFRAAVISWFRHTSEQDVSLPHRKPLFLQTVQRNGMHDGCISLSASYCPKFLSFV